MMKKSSNIYSLSNKRSSSNSPRSSISSNRRSKIPSQIQDVIVKNSLGQRQEQQINILQDVFVQQTAKLRQTVQRVVSGNQTQSKKKNQINNQLFECQCLVCCYKFQNPQDMHHLCKCEHVFCGNCLNQYIIYKINSLEDLCCPQEDCNAQIDQNSQIFKELPDKVKKRYNRQKNWKQLSKQPNLKICPNDNCENGIVDMLKTPPECRQCHQKFCPDCMMKYHSGSCDKELQNNYKQWRRCPHCRLFINKDGGCNHVVCRCGAQFCFVCLVDWEDSHYQCIDIDSSVFRYCLAGRPLLTFILMILLIPVIVVVLVLILAIMIICAILGGIFVCPIIVAKETGFIILVILFLPFVMICSIIFLIGVFFFLGFIPLIYNGTFAYCRLQKSLITRAFQ